MRRDLEADKQYLKEVESASYLKRESIIIANHAIDRAIAAERSIADINQMVQDIEYQIQQADPHPALLGIIVTVNTIKKVLTKGGKQTNG